MMVCSAATSGAESKGALARALMTRAALCTALLRSADGSTWHQSTCAPLLADPASASDVHVFQWGLWAELDLLQSNSCNFTIRTVGPPSRSAHILLEV